MAAYLIADVEITDPAAMDGYVLDTLAIYPHFPRAVLEAGDVFLSRTCWHCSCPFAKELRRWSRHQTTLGSTPVGLA